MNIEKDSFASGQVGSKIWLAEELEKIRALRKKKDLTIWVLGGWYGILPFVLLSRGNLHIRRIVSFDVDPGCKEISENINNFWNWKEGQFISWTEDANNLSYADPGKYWSETPNLIVNTSTEHFSQMQWWDNIPKETLVALQSCNLEHEQHISCVGSEAEMQKKYPFKKMCYSGTLNFDYGNKSSFERYMIIGKK